MPCSSANIGPGFDVIGLALSVWLEIRIDVSQSATTKAPLNCVITYEGEGADEVSLSAERNLITRTAIYVLRCHGQRQFPGITTIHIINPIPLGRGLGSSGAAVVAGVVLGNEVGKLGLSKARMLDFCLMIGMNCFIYDALLSNRSDSSQNAIQITWRPRCMEGSWEPI